MNALPDLTQEEIDAALERRIECARLAMTYAADEAGRKDHFLRMQLLIAQRSPQQIARMEKQRGLRA